MGVDHVLHRVLDSLRLGAAVPPVEVADGWEQRHDFSVALGRWAWFDVAALVEEHAQGRVLVRHALGCGQASSPCWPPSWRSRASSRPRSPPPPPGGPSPCAGSDAGRRRDPGRGHLPHGRRAGGIARCHRSHPRDRGRQFGGGGRRHDSILARSGAVALRGALDAGEPGRGWHAARQQPAGARRRRDDREAVRPSLPAPVEAKRAEPAVPWIGLAVAPDGDSTCRCASGHATPRLHAARLGLARFRRAGANHDAPNRARGTAGNPRRRRRGPRRRSVHRRHRDAPGVPRRPRERIGHRRGWFRACGRRRGRRPRDQGVAQPARRRGRGPAGRPLHRGQREQPRAQGGTPHGTDLDGRGRRDAHGRRVQPGGRRVGDQSGPALPHRPGRGPQSRPLHRRHRPPPHPPRRRAHGAHQHGGGRRNAGGDRRRRTGREGPPLVADRRRRGGARPPGDPLRRGLLERPRPRRHARRTDQLARAAQRDQARVPGTGGLPPARLPLHRRTWPGPVDRRLARGASAGQGPTAARDRCAARRAM